MADGVFPSPAERADMETWDSLFKRAAAFDVSQDAIQDALADIRGDE